MSPSDKTGSRPDKDIFFDALDISTAEDRRVFLDHECAGDFAKRGRLDELISNHFEQGGFMQGSAARESRKLSAALDDDSGQVAGRFKLLEKLGEGGFGVVYVAEQREPVKRRVALKIIKLGMDTRQIVARFEAERQALAMMDHPNIAKVFDAGATETGRPYFVMELVRGVRITDYCAENELPIQERLKLFTQVCQAIQHAHQKGIIHRDIKPSNILITLHDGVPVPKVIDFGIAKAVEGDLTEKTVYTQFHQFIGTPAYVSPEQAEMSGLDVDTRTDIYALGVLLYELLTGHTPFDGKELLQSGLEQMRKTIREKEPLRPSTRLRHASSKASHPIRQSPLATDLDWIVMKCLAKDRARRYETANGLARDIQRHLNNEPVTARAPTASYKLYKFAQRNQAAVVVISGILAMLVTGIVISVRHAAIANKARREAVVAKDQETRERLRADGQKRLAERNYYLASMTLAQNAWEKNLFVGVRQTLEEMADNPYRGFEWSYLFRRMNMHVREFRGQGQVGAWSSDGKWVASGGDDPTIRLLDANTGLLKCVFTGHTDTINAIDFSPDGGRLISGSMDGTARLWDTATGKEISVLRRGVHRVWSLDFSPDARKMAIACGEINVWDANTGAELFSLPGGVKVEFSPDSRLLATSDGRQVTVHDADSGEIVANVKREPRPWVVSLHFSPDGKKLFITNDDGSVQIIDSETGDQLRMLQAHRGYAQSVSFSPDGRQFATSGADGLIVVWDGQTFEKLYTITAGDRVTTVSYSPDGRHLLSAEADGVLKTWLADPSSAGQEFRFPGSTFTYSAFFSADGRQILTSAHDGVARLWDARTGVKLKEFKGHTQSLSRAEFFRDNTRLATVSVDGLAKVWDLATGEEILKFEGHREPIYALAISLDGRQVFTASSDKNWVDAHDLTGKLWDAATGTELLAIKGAGRWAAFSPDGKRLASGAQLGTQQACKIWDLTTGRATLLLPGFGGPVAFSPDGGRLVVAGTKSARIWDAQTGAPLAILHGHTDLIYSVSFSRDGRRIVTGGQDGTVRLWDSDTGKEVLMLTGGGGMVSTAQFSPDEQRIVAANGEEIVVWEAASPEEVDRFKGSK